jgi:hypothetical protein
MPLFVYRSSRALMHSDLRYPRKSLSVDLSSSDAASAHVRHRLATGDVIVARSATSAWRVSVYLAFQPLASLRALVAAQGVACAQCVTRASYAAASLAEWQKHALAFRQWHRNIVSPSLLTTDSDFVGYVYVAQEDELRQDSRFQRVGRLLVMNGFELFAGRYPPHTHTTTQHSGWCGAQTYEKSRG